MEVGGSIFGGKIDSFWGGFPRSISKKFQDAPKTSHNALKTLPRRPKTPKAAPRRPRDAPKTFPGRPKTPPRSGK